MADDENIGGYFEVVGDLDGREERREFHYIGGGWINEGRKSAHGQALLAMEVLRGMGFRCRLYHHLTHLLEEDE